jgi:MFS family permease
MLRVTALDSLAAARETKRAQVQRHTLRTLFGTQVAGGIGTTIGISVGGVLAARLGGVSVSGLAQSCAVIGAAALAVPTAKLMSWRGRRPGLAVAYLTGAIGAATVVLAAHSGQVWLMFIGMLLFGGGSTANLQARYSAVDLSEPTHRARQLSIVVAATTIGAVLAPNLAGPADDFFGRLGAPDLTGPFIVSILAFGVAGITLALVLRPDPLLTARLLREAVAESPAPARRATVAEAWRAILDSPGARLAVGAVATGHLVMVGVMSMTPVHIMGASMGGAHADADTLRLVGIVISVHVAGMYAMSPLVGMLADRIGRRSTILVGILALLGACLCAGAAGESTVQLAVGLLLLGCGWSCLVVAGSTLLTETVEADVRPAAQGLSDLTMGIAGAVSGGLSGFVVDHFSYGTLTVVAALATVPLLAAALRPAAAPASGV